MEVSSHALDQRRIHGIAFDAAVFTNLTRDHLDYHKTMQSYFTTKARLISYLQPDGVAVINADDLAWGQLPVSPRRLTFGLYDGDVRATDVTYTKRGSAWLLHHADHTAEVHLPLIGDFNVSNAIAAAAAALAVGIPFQEVAARLCTVPQVPGRLELLADAPTVLRDYAHTPDALQRALAAIRPFTPGRIIVVFGAGGDRDAGKRPIMGAIAQRDADVAIVTSDNPRTEPPGSIIDDIEQGMIAGKHERIPDRRAAIAWAITLADRDDVVLLAGKGHETYQVIGTEKHNFDERLIVNELLASM
jgi:UDP-N-acetylmuramoyl-L-alanyl-D-glutamate--2,6-diaminopimelate ligase